MPRPPEVENHNGGVWNQRKRFLIGAGLALGGESYSPLQRFDFLWCERVELTHR